MNSFDGADELAAAATHTKLGSSLRYGKTTLERNHVDSLYSAVLGAGSAAGTVHVDYADVLVEYHTTRLGAMLLLNGERLDFSGTGAWIHQQCQSAARVRFFCFLPGRNIWLSACMRQCSQNNPRNESSQWLGSWSLYSKPCICAGRPGSGCQDRKKVSAVHT